MMLWHGLIDPFLSFGFMRRALMACLALSLSAAPLGVFLLLRRMSLVGDALSHAVLPGAAIGYLISGMSLVAMGVGGFIAGLAVAMLSGLVSRRTPLKEDASFAGFYLGSLALGVTLVSLRGSSVDLLHVLFGSILAVDAQAMLMVGAIASVSLLALAALYRALVIESFDVTVPARQRAAPVGADPRPVSGAGGGQSGGGIPDPRHSDVGGADDAARRQRALLGAQSAADAGDGDGHRRAFQPDWVGVVLLRFAARRPGDRAQRQRHLFRLDPVWNAWRHLRLRAPLRSAICKEKV